MKKNPAVFLDRDGVIVKSNVIKGKPFAVRSLRDFRLLPGAIKSISRIKSLGFKVIVITNQPDVAKKKLTLKTLCQMNAILRKKIDIDDIFVCIHKKEDNCRCRKPKNGLLKKAHKKYNIDFKNSFFVGDRYVDIECGIRSGCRTIFINRNYLEKKPEFFEASFNSLILATKYIVDQKKKMVLK